MSTFRNEEDILPEFIRRVHAALDSLGISYEILFVNDDSTDKSIEILKDLSQSDKRIKCVNTSRRFGVERCLLAGFRYARGNAVVTLDTDLQDPPEIIPQMVQEWRKGFDVVHTVRTRRYGELPLRVWLTKLAYKIISFFSDEVQMTPNAGMFKLISRRALDEILKLSETDSLYVRGLAVWVGFRQTNIFYEREKRAGGYSHFPLRMVHAHAKFTLDGIISFSTLLLYLPFFTGILLCGISLFHFVMMWVSDGRSNLLSWLFLLGGVQSLLIGILGFYLASIHKETKRRPPYIVQSTLGMD